MLDSICSFSKQLQHHLPRTSASVSYLKDEDLSVHGCILKLSLRIKTCWKGYVFKIYSMDFNQHILRSVLFVVQVSKQDCIHNINRRIHTSMTMYQTRICIHHNNSDKYIMSRNRHSNLLLLTAEAGSKSHSV